MLSSIPGTAAFASRDFRRYQMARLMVIMGAEAQAVAVAWQVYEITHRAVDLGYTGLLLFLPGLLFLLPSGHVADRFDRRTVILVCYTLQGFCTLALLALAWRRVHNVAPIFALLFLIGSGRAFSAPASAALLPHLVPADHFVNAVTWGSTVLQIANITGPAVGGLLYTLPWGPNFPGASAVFTFALATELWFLLLVGTLHARPGRMEHRDLSVSVLLAGFRYVWRAKMLLGSISLDLFVVLLGGATALLPIYAADILHTGPQGLGLLRAAPAFGALIVSMRMAFLPMKRRAGIKMLIGVGFFGAATMVFGVSTHLAVSVAALTVVGASDMMSVVVRSSMLQLATPASMRGRVSAVNSLFVGASNELGEFESGVTAQWWGAVRAVVIGGIGSMVVTGLWAILFPALRGVDKLSADSLRIPEAEIAEDVRRG